MATAGSGISVEVRGRLEPDELAFLWHVRSRLQMGRPVRLLAFAVLLFFVCGLGLSMYLSSRVRGAVPGTTITWFACLFVALLDVSGLNFMRYRVTARLFRRQTREHIVQFGDDGVRYAPVGQETSHTSFGWPQIDLLSTPEGVVVAVREAAVPILFIPERALSVTDRRGVITLALANGARVLDGPRGRLITASPSGEIG